MRIMQESQEQPNAELKRNKKKEGEEKHREDKSTLTRTLGSAVDKLFEKSTKIDELFSQLDLPTDEEIITGLEDAAGDLDDKLNMAYDQAQIMLREASKNVDEVVTNALTSLEHFKSSWHVNSAKKKLQKIFTRPDIDYLQKSDLIESVRKIVTSVKDLNALAELYVFINLPENKDKLNIHRSPVKDTLLLNHNTASWQKLLDQIREHAFTRLLSKAKINQQQCTSFLAGQKVNLPLEDRQDVYDLLKKYSKEPIFCQHHSNKNFFNLFHSTHTSGKIKDLLNYYKIECEEIKKLKARIYN